MKTWHLIILTLAAGAAESVLAHTELAETVPADRSVVAEAPADVRLRFSEPVRLTALSIQKDGEAKRSLGPLPADTTESFAVALGALTAGHYVVSWRALSEDTHVASGEFMFALGTDGNHGEHMEQGAMPASEHETHEDADHHDDHGQH